MLNALERENRIADAALVGNLMQTSTFFSSTAVLILGAMLTHGTRSYYYAVPVLLWFVNAWLLLGTALLMTLLLYWMDFRSATVSALAESETHE